MNMHISINILCATAAEGSDQLSAINQKIKRVGTAELISSTDIATLQAVLVTPATDVERQSHRPLNKYKDNIVHVVV